MKFKSQRFTLASSLLSELTGRPYRSHRTADGKLVTWVAKHPPHSRRAARSAVAGRTRRGPGGAGPAAAGAVTGELLTYVRKAGLWIVRSLSYAAEPRGAPLPAAPDMDPAALDPLLLGRSQP